MIINSIGLSLPQRIVTNEEIVEMVRLHSQSCYRGDLNQALQYIGRKLSSYGLKTRLWCGKNEKPIDHMLHAVKECFRDTDVNLKDVDLLVFTGLGKGVLEPANSYLAAKMLGLKNVQCFDISDACNGWTRTLFLVDALFKANHYRHALVINTEFFMHSDGFIYPQNFILENEKELAYKMQSYTMGEAATATLLSAEHHKTQNHPFTFFFESDTCVADLCLIPLPGYQNFYSAGESEYEDAKPLSFTVRGDQIYAALLKKFPDFLKQHMTESVDKIFTHTSPPGIWEHFAEPFGLKSKLFAIYPETGNLVSAALPGAMVIASEQGELKRGDHIAFWNASPGASLSIARFQF